MINRKELVARHNPILKKVDVESPLTVGNGEFAYTADITGMQTLYREYEQAYNPLCTMSQWGWHTKKVNSKSGIYTMDDLEMTRYEYMGREITYAVERKEGNEAVYEWLRHNPHRIHLGSVGFLWEGKTIEEKEITNIHQQLKLYEGHLVSEFTIGGYLVKVLTCCHPDKDLLFFQVESEAIKAGKLQIVIRYSYGSHKITGADWNTQTEHLTTVEKQEQNLLKINRQMGDTVYYNVLQSEQAFVAEQENHEITITGTESKFDFSLGFYQQEEALYQTEAIAEKSRLYWKQFWETGAAVELYQSKDERGFELERRIILSQYLVAIQSCGSIPPQETGLTCNSWYGKFHLEMHLWHSAFLPLWGKGELLKRSLPWYKKHLKTAIENAGRNGFQGAKWPKMIAENGVDSPSIIATLLIWQQPHIIYMLELLYQSEQNDEFLTEYWEIVKETAIYMADYAYFNEETRCYDLPAPIIPAQEEFDPTKTWNPTFELEYWSFTLKIAAKWAKRLGKTEVSKEWKDISENMARLPVKDGVYLSHENCPDTFEKYNKDHPSMVGALGLLAGERVDKDIMKQTLKRVLEEWDFATMWGWDFAMMAMTAVRLGEPEMAIEILLRDTPKNTYVSSGNNYQRLRTDLPLYLPGNGSLLLAVAMMTAGYQDCEEALPGFPKNGMWQVNYEDMNPFPY